MARKKSDVVKDVEEVEKVDKKKTVEKVDEKAPKKSEKKVDNKKKTKSEKAKKEGFLAGVRKELKKVVWPKGLEIVKYTFAVIVFCVLLSLFFELIDLIVAVIKGLFV